jgi:uncharacterized membrane protein
MLVRDEITIAAPIERVWDIYADVERWPTWTASVTSVELVEGAAIAIGSRARIRQPRLPKLVWTVTSVDPGRSWTWVTHAPGATTTAEHVLRALDDGTTHVTQSIEQRGALGVVVGRLIRGLTGRYLAMEAAGLKRRVEADVTTT